MTVRVLANATSAKPGGGLSYILRQLAALETVRPDIDLRVLAAPWNATDIEGAVQSPVTVIDVPNAASRFIYEQLRLPSRLSTDTILYSPGNFASFPVQARKQVLTLQNPNYFGEGRRYPSNRGVKRRLKIALSHASIRRSARVIAISESLATEVRADFPNLGDRLVVIPSGHPTWTTPAVRPPSFTTDSDFFLSVANDYPHKELDLLVKAWARLASETALVLAGEVGADRIAAHLSLVPVAMRHRLLHLGPVGDRAHLRWLLEHARAMVAPSSLEAYPLTPAEGGAVGCPLILSDIPAHRETAGDHAVYVARRDEASLVAAMADALNQSGRQHWALDRTWQRNALELSEVFDEVTRGA